ncbi:MAG: helix-turn-helix transcriptional regulator [Actinoplanes sp.]
MGSSDRFGPVTLAGLLRSWRSRADPADHGLDHANRRIAGLRRGELARLAGVSVDYLVRLEQGRALHPSPSVLGALGEALRLNTEEVALLHRAAGLAAPAETVDHSVPPSVLRLVERIADCPVAVYSMDWWLLHWNPLWSALLGDPHRLVGRDRNLVWREFRSGGSPVSASRTAAERQQFRLEIVGDLRAASVEHPDDRKLTAMVRELTEHSADFASLWSVAHPVRRRTERKRVVHPVVGAVEFDCDILEVPAGELHVVVYSAAPGSQDNDRLRRLLP